MIRDVLRERFHQKILLEARHIQDNYEHVWVAVQAQQRQHQTVHAHSRA
jgi:hypothetical protein